MAGVVVVGVVVVGAGEIGRSVSRISAMFPTDLPPVAFAPTSLSGQIFLPLTSSGRALPFIVEATR